MRVAAIVDRECGPATVPEAPSDCSAIGAVNVRPPSVDRAILMAVAAPRAFHNTVTVGSGCPATLWMATRGGNSPPEPALAWCAIHLHGRVERASAIPARGDKHVSLAVGAGAPCDSHERTVGRHRGRGVGAARHVERHDATGG